VLGAAIDRVCRWLAKDHVHRIEATTCWQMTRAAMRAARATNLGPILRLRAYPGLSTVTIGGQPDPATNVYLDAEGRFVAIGMPKSGVR
jgi:hypothetical protein